MESQRFASSIASSCFNYYCISTVRKLTKVIATGQLEYSKELVKELEESFGTLLESFDSIAL